MSIDKLKNKFFTGAWLPDSKHYFKKINEIIDRLNGIGTSGDGSYKVYTALLSQSGTDAPTAVVLNNTFGVTVTPSRAAAGFYALNAPSMFPNYNKIFIPSFGNSVAGAVLWLPIYSGAAITGYYTIASNNANNLNIYVTDAIGNNIDFSDIINPANQIPIEIRIYN